MSQTAEQRMHATPLCGPQPGRDSDGWPYACGRPAWGRAAPRNANVRRQYLARHYGILMYRNTYQQYIINTHGVFLIRNKAYKSRA
jgi:hypothetical protein